MNFGNVLILGDSFSTFEGYIPEGYLTYYGENTEKNTDVRKVEYTWWHQLMKETNSNLVLNNSWSGSTICYTGYDGYDCSKDSSFIFRVRQLIENGFFAENKIDTVFLLGASNDSGANSPLGELKYDHFEEKDLYEWNARVQITTWGNRAVADQGKLRDYAHKEWNGILKDFYYKRWKMFLDGLAGSLNGTPAPKWDWYAIEEPWTKVSNTYTGQPEGDCIEVAKRVYTTIWH